MNTFVIVHGAWAGGWFFQETARFLRAAENEVYTPTLTGIGERVHLGHPDIDLDTHIQDIVNVLEYEDLEDVSLVGYSYGGMVVTGVAERVPERIKQLIYLDAFVPEDGQSLADIMPDMAVVIENAARELGDGWKIPHDPPHPRKTSHPLMTMKQTLKIGNAAATRLPRSYVLFTQNFYPFAQELAKTAARVQKQGWRYRELAADHLAPDTHAEELASILDELK